MNTQNDDTPDDADQPAEGSSGIPTDRRPLGFWLRAVDELLTAEFAKAFAAEGITRREWMLLNALSGDVELAGFAERIARKGKRLRVLEDRGWAEEQGDGTWQLTDEGRAAKERLGAIVDGIRGRVSGAVTPEDFATTMASLEAIARELGWDEETRTHRGFGFGPRGRRGFGPGFRSGFGPGFGHGFRPGFGHGFRPGFGPGFGDDDGREGARHGERPGLGRHSEHGHTAHGHGHPHDGHGERSHGEHGHGKHRGHHSERAYERGFEAGFTAAARSRQERSA
ncbi:MAG: hypothetical protein ABWY55_05210 [Microbacterium sp.]